MVRELFLLEYPVRLIRDNIVFINRTLNQVVLTFYSALFTTLVVELDGISSASYLNFAPALSVHSTNKYSLILERIILVSAQQKSISLPLKKLEKGH